MRPTTAIPTLLSLLLCAAPAFAGDGAKPEHPRKHDGKELKERLEKFDANHDGKLDDGEKAAARAAFAALIKEKRPELFARIDADGDGALSEAEMKTAREKLKERRQKHRDGDGQGRTQAE